MCGGSEESRRNVTERERRYLEELIRGVYTRKELQAGYTFSSQTFDEDFYLAIPLHKGQLSCREVINGEKLTADIGKDEMLTINHIDGPYNQNETLRQTILNRGIQN
jgi:N-acetylneuraminate synthase